MALSDYIPGFIVTLCLYIPAVLCHYYYRRFNLFSAWMTVFRLIIDIATVVLLIYFGFFIFFSLDNIPMLLMYALGFITIVFFYFDTKL
ncbi:hypothetical protein [Psittacicella hinzii]|uniref:Uncharacterized protein n=1 Tax=Psittacicella hinzii TaxID=2028575 RepID=A0A3A1YPD6_9GAMM|nr:hypothetical protein [Psittacicella hinzii]RIY38820.1 hypothetical protein CKF58_03320 [Psittacicella hinzii]